MFYAGCLLLALPHLLLPESQVATSARTLSFYLLICGLIMAIPMALTRFARPQLSGRAHVSAGGRLRAAGVWSGYLRWCVVAMVPGFFLQHGDDVTALAFGLLALVLSALIRFVYPLVTPGENWQRAMLAGQLAVVVKMEASLPEALDQLYLESISDIGRKRHRFPTVLAHLAFDLRQGSLLSGAVAAQAFFPSLWVSLIRFGERSERLGQVLQQISLIERNRPQRLQLLRPLLMVPVIAVLGWGATDSMLDLMQGLGYIENFVLASRARTVIFLLLGLAVLLVTLPVLRLPGGLQRLGDRLQRVPLLWPLIQTEQQQLAIYALAAGASLEKSLEEVLELGQDSVTHSAYRQALDPELARRGHTLAQVVARSPALFCSEVLALIEYGERHEQLNESLQECQVILANQLAERQVQHESQVVVMFHVLTALLVLCMACAIFVPLIQMGVSVMSEASLP